MSDRCPKCGWYVNQHGLCESNICVRRQLAAALADNERLRGIVERLPKTADGAHAHHGMRVYRPGERDYGTVTFHVCGEGGFDAIGRWYSTPEAAEAAQEKP